MKLKSEVRQETASLLLPEVYRNYLNGVERKDYPYQEGWRDGIAIEAVRIADCLIEALENVK